MRAYGLYILDLDGTLYRGRDPIPGAGDTVAELKRRGALVRFLTNNSSQTPEAQSAKLTQMGIDAWPHEIATSAIGAAQYLKDAKLGSAFVVGEPGLVAVLEDAGIETKGEVNEAVVVGICRDFTYDLMNQAMQRIRHGARFIATNPDATYPLEGDRQIPGAGAVVAAIQTCTGETPVVIGKPNPYLVRMLMTQTGVGPEDTIVVGDRVETDMLAGRAAGCDTLIVLTGVTKEAPEGERSTPTLRALLS